MREFQKRSLEACSTRKGHRGVSREIPWLRGGGFLLSGRSSRVEERVSTKRGWYRMSIWLLAPEGRDTSCFYARTVSLRWG